MHTWLLQVRAAEAMFNAGADALDLGAESTRPGAVRVSEDEEMLRLVPVVKAIRAAGEWGQHAVISVDTTRASVAAAAVCSFAPCLVRSNSPISH